MKALGANNFIQKDYSMHINCTYDVNLALLGSRLILVAQFVFIDD